MISLEVKQFEGYCALVDSTGCFCGFYNTLEEANTALPRVQENINRGKVHRLCVKEIKDRFNLMKKFTKRNKESKK